LPCKLYDASVAVSADGSTVYVTAGSAPDDNTYHNVYCYDMKSDNWTVLPLSGHSCGVLHMLDGRLIIFGGQDLVTCKYHNKVTTYNSDTNSWYSYYPDMLNKRFKPGIITYHDHVIVMGGVNSPGTILDSIEVMNYHQQLQWREVSVHLPIPMWDIKPTISGEYITIVGYSQDGGRNNGYYKIAVEEVMSSLNQSTSTGAVSTAQWKKMSAAPYWNTVTVPYSNPPVIIGGSSHANQGSVATCDISIYNASKNLWRKMNLLTSARKHIGVDFINHNAIIIIGGASGGVGAEGVKASSLTTVEIGNIVPNQQ